MRQEFVVCGITALAGFSCLSAVGPASATESVLVGLYIGGHGGGAWGNARDADRSEDGSQPAKANLNGGHGGAHVGFNLKLGQFVIGVEGDYSAGMSDGSTSWREGGVDFTISNELDSTATVRARAGFSVGSFLLFGTAGVGFADYKLSFSGREIATGVSASITGSDKVSGFVGGGGVEWRVMPNLSIRGEVLHYAFDDAKIFFTTLDGQSRVNVDLEQTVVRAGMSLHFN